MTSIYDLLSEKASESTTGNLIKYVIISDFNQTKESFLSCIDSLSINPEEKNFFINKLQIL